MLTPQLLETFPYYQHADYKTIQRGQQYFRDGHVYEIEYYDDYAICQVEGNNDDYEVIISLTAETKSRQNVPARMQSWETSASTWLRPCWR